METGGAAPAEAAAAAEDGVVWEDAANIQVCYPGPVTVCWQGMHGVPTWRSALTTDRALRRWRSSWRRERSAIYIGGGTKIRMSQ